MKGVTFNIVTMVAVSAAASTNVDYKQRARELIGQMSLDEKLTFVSGVEHASPYTGTTAEVARLNIPSLHMNDGPQGFRDEDCKEPAFMGCTTSFPAALTIAASFDVDVAFKYGDAMGKEFAMKGSNMQLGPGVNVARVPVNGRNFEYISGEDPFLGAAMVAPVVKGIQSHGVLANMKHYVLNNQETNRNSVSSIVDERTRWEIYYPPFQSAVEAGVASAMCSYNRVNGIYSCENDVTLNELKKGMRFEGFVVSDWGATHSTVQSAMAGLDIQMPDSEFFGQALKDAITTGQVAEDVLDEKVFRVLSQMYKFGIMDKGSEPSFGNFTANITSLEHDKVSRELAVASTVLLQNNNNALPLCRHKVKNIAIIGNGGHLRPIVHGGGSGQVYPAHIITTLQGISNAVSDDVKITYNPTPQNDTDIASINEATADADIVIFVVGSYSSEGRDRDNLNLFNHEDDMVTKINKSGKRSIVIINSVGAVLLPWSDSVDAILAAFMPGQEAGNAIADVLFGKNPSARLPITFPNIENELNFTAEQYPGVMNKEGTFTEATYSEKLLVGYRYYDYHQIQPKFPFGHGLSYTKFDYSNIKIHNNSKGLASVSFTLQNVGEVDGADIPQLYLSFPADRTNSGYLEAPRQLKGFKKIFLKKDEAKEVVFTLEPRDFSYYDLFTHSFVLRSGTFTVSIGKSSRDFQLVSSITIEDEGRSATY